MEINKVFDLIESNQLDELSKVLNQGFDVNGSDSDGYSLLHMAVDFDNEAAVRLLLTKEGCRVNCCTHFHRLTPLHFAAQDGKCHLVRLLVELGANVNYVNHTNCTPLYFATCSNHLAIAKLLLDSGADPNIEDTNKMSALLQAVTMSKELTQLLLERGAQMTSHCRELHSSLLSNRADIADLLLDRLSPPLSANRIGRTPLQNAVQHINCDNPEQGVKLIRRMIEFGQDINVCNQFGTLLHILIQRNKLTNGFDEDLTGEAIFKYLVFLDNCNLDTYIAINGTGYPISLAFRLNKYRLSEMLIKAGTDITYCQLNNFKYTKNAETALKMLFYSGYSFDPMFSTQMRPSSEEELFNFNLFNQWLESQRSQVMSLKNLCRTFLRNFLKRKVNRIISELDLPQDLKLFILLNDISRT